VIAALLVALSIVRGIYVGTVENPARDTLALSLPRNDWTAALAWMREHSPKHAFVLADPGHAWKPGMGTAVRIGAERDVFLEETKDIAMALYSGAVAHQVTARIGPATLAVDGDVGALQALAAREGLTHFVSNRELTLPVLFAAGSTRVYALAPP
jgi:hypothetical protein